MDADEEYDNDGGLAMYESRKSGVSLAKQAVRERANQVCSWQFAVGCQDRFNAFICISAGQGYLVFPLYESWK